MTQNIKSISKSKFDLYRFAYPTLPSFLGQEIAWFSDINEKILATIILDACDSDYAAILLGKDEIGRMRCFDSEASFPSPNDAILWISKQISSLQRHDEVFPQEDCDSKKKLELFKDIAKKEKQHFNYKTLRDRPEWNSARNLIEKIMPFYTDVDGNFIQQFQSDGFNQRLWELFLFNFFIEEGLDIDRTRNAPDFVVRRDDLVIGIEAVATSTSLHTSDDIALRWSGALSNKLKHTSQENKNAKKNHYWEKEGLKDKPFVIAIQNFYNETSESVELSILNEMLFGYDFTKNPPKKVELYTKPNGSKIPSGFFFNQENVEHLSAVIATPLGILSTFNRIGKERGFDTHNTIMFHQGVRIENSKPQEFVYQVKECEFAHEKWSDGMVVIHNPNARNPLPKSSFQNAVHIYFNSETKRLEPHYKSFFPFLSKTTTFTPDC